jgi:hypothetical protein
MWSFLPCGAQKAKPHMGEIAGEVAPTGDGGGIENCGNLPPPMLTNLGVPPPAHGFAAIHLPRFFESLQTYSILDAGEESPAR